MVRCFFAFQSGLIVKPSRDCHKSDVSQTEKDKYQMLSLIHGILKKWYK